MADATPASGGDQSTFVRVGGLAVVLTLALHVVLGMMRELPPAGATLPELRSYLDREAGVWAMVHGLRYPAIVGLVIYGAALHRRTREGPTASGTGWGMVGVIGITIHVTNLAITNGIEIMAFHRGGLVSEESALFWMLVQLTRVLFTAEIVAWGISIFGFSMAGYQSARLPRWTSFLGFVSAAACLLSGVFVVSILAEGKAIHLLNVAAVSALAWFAVTGVHMMLHGDSSQ